MDILHFLDRKIIIKRFLNLTLLPKSIYGFREFFCANIIVEILLIEVISRY